MSHRVTVQTEIKDKAVAISALTASKLSYTESGDTLRITSGNLANVSINLKTGEVSGDTDYRSHTKDNLGLLRQNYAEAKFAAECHKNGITVDERSVDREGNIILLTSMA